MRSETTGPRISHWHPYRRKCARLRIPGPITLRETGASTLQIPIADFASPADGKIAVTERRRMPRLAAWRPDGQWRAAVMGWRRVTTILGPGPGAGEPWPWEVLDATRRCLAKRRPLPAIQPLAIPVAAAVRLLLPEVTIADWTGADHAAIGPLAGTGGEQRQASQQQALRREHRAGARAGHPQYERNDEKQGGDVSEHGTFLPVRRDTQINGSATRATPPPDRTTRGHDGRRLGALLAGLRDQAFSLGVHANVIERASQDCHGYRPALGTVGAGSAVVAALPGGDRPDDQPHDHHAGEDTHVSPPAAAAAIATRPSRCARHRKAGSRGVARHISFSSEFVTIHR